jgi:adenylate cyclase
MTQRRVRSLGLGLVTALLAAAWALMVAAPHRTGQSSLIDPVESFLFNVRLSTFGAITPSDRVVVVAIDDATLQSANPLGTGRANLARIIDATAHAGASVISLDILLADAHDPQADETLAKALGSVTSVIAAAGAIATPDSQDQLPTLGDELWPQSVFSAASQIGIANISTDDTGVPRHVPIVFMTTAGLQPSLSAQTAARLLGQQLDLSEGVLRLGERRVPLDFAFQMPLRLAGPGGTIQTVSALSLLAGDAQVDLTGKAAIIGVTATGLGDRFPTPYDPALPGVEVMATAVSQLVDGDGLRRDQKTRNLDVVAATGLAICVSLLAMLLPLTIGVSLAGGLVLLWIILVWVAFSSGVWLSAALPLAAAVPPLMTAALIRFTHEQRQAAVSGRAVVELKKFQSPQLAEMIAADPTFLAVPETRHLTICFVDLSGFTQLSQGLGAQRSAKLLKRFHADLALIAQQNGGTILTYMGDGALIVFGLFDPPLDVADRTLSAGFEMARRTRALGQSEGLDQPLALRIGLHHGEVILSRMGGDRHQQLTVTGDSVNLSSRLLEIAKAKGATIAATQEFMAQLRSPRDHPVRSGTKSLPVRGRAGEVHLSFWRF